MKRTFSQRVLSVLLCAAMLLAYVPGGILRANAAAGDIKTVADPATLTRPGTIYGDNTANAGKVTVGKSVSDTDITVGGQNIAVSGDNNFLVTISQAAQSMGLTSQSSVPVDVVFVLDTSNSMAGSRVTEMITAANNAIATLMAANEYNRVAVVAFSGSQGGGTSGGASANVLTYLDHFTGDAATNHIQWVNSQGSTTGRNRTYIQGRGTDAGRRSGTSQGTNIHAGVALGGKLLAEQTNTTVVTADGKTVTRMPFLVVMSDGAPSIAAGGNWYAPSMTQTIGSIREEDGLGYLAAITAAYYKGLITENYFGNAASNTNRCYVYTMGLGLSSGGLAEMTMDPSGASSTTNSYFDNFENYWTDHEDGEDYRVSVSGSSTYTVTGTSIAATKKYVYGTGLGYTGSYKYNDEYFSASEAGDLHDAFTSIVSTIQHKAVSVPTQVSSGDHNYDGYVNFYDPIGEYMEVKDMKGVIADGFFYQGVSAAQHLANYGTAAANPKFDELIHSVIKTRMGLSSADDRFATEAELDAFIHNLLIAARDSDNQANPGDNSIVWWGNAYDAGEEDEHVQLISFADNDTIEYIEQQKAADGIPAGTDYVCRSYFFYGEAGGANTNPEHLYLYFVVRVQRELTAPYRETVVISAPASLLSVEKVLINETFDDDGDPVYSATVEHKEPARVVYEVGLWDSITPETVSMLVSPDYTGETVNGEGSVNYDAATDTYHFFTNDWDRTQNPDSHHRGMAKATFDAAADNAFYAYQQDTLIVDANGNAVTSDPAGTTAYYERTYYEWSDSGNDGTYNATKKTKLIPVELSASADLLQKDGRWYLEKGVYTAATLIVNGDDTMKDDPSTSAANDGNLTGTSFIVAHPHRTGSVNNSHYTVFLGNNGKLSLTADPYKPEKTVSVNLADNAAALTEDNGKPVLPGDVLTYTVAAKNILTETADLTVTDYIPSGTAFVAGSAGFGTAETGHTKDVSIQPDSNNVLTWVLEDVPAGDTVYVSFQVTVLNTALSTGVVPGTINNTASYRIGNNPTVYTNPTSNPPYGKSVSDLNGTDVDGQGGYKVGDTLVYYIRFANTATDAAGNPVAADVTVTDKIPEGTTYVEGSASDGGAFAGDTLTWNFPDMAAGETKLLHFLVKIDASAKINATGTQPDSGEITMENSAIILVEGEPTITTNTTVNKVSVGDMVITKTVAQGGDRSKTFTIHLSEATGLLDGIYMLARDGAAETVTFNDGKATVTIQHGQTLTIQGLPAGAIITVAEDVSALPGWTASYNTQSVTITEGAAAAVSSVAVTNAYTLQPLTVQLNGVKTMTGAAMTNPVTFGFLAVPDSSNPEVGDSLSGEVTVTGNGSYNFAMSSKTFTKPGTYTYTITEINGGVLGVDYDTTAHVLVLDIIDNGDGTMSAQCELDGVAFDPATGVVSFSNNYNPEDTQLIITADKAMTGRTLTPGEFTFTLTDGVNTYTGINDAEGNILFQTITYTATGVHTYTMSEVIPTPKANGVTYDTDTHTVVVTVSDINGQLTPTVTVDGAAKTVADSAVDTGVVFRNSFVPDDVPVQVIAKKTLMVYNTATGAYEATAPEANEFHFQILDENGNSVSTGANDGSGNIAFETIYFSADMLSGVTAVGGNKTKTFTYTIKEIVPELAKDPNMKYDQDGKTFTVMLTLTAGGELTVDTNSSGNVLDLTGSANFINYSNPETVSVTPTGKKTTTGSNLPENLSFSFNVLPVGGTTDAATGISDPTVGGSDSETTGISFTSMVYNTASLGGEATKTYSYWIMESNASAGNVTGSNGVTYDATRYLYQVTLSRDSYNRLIATERYFKLAPNGQIDNAADYTVEITGAEVSFRNTYAAEARINLTATKVLTGRAPSLAANEFDFVLQRLDAAGNIVPGSHITGTNEAAASGKIHFATLNYSNAMLDDAYAINGAYYFCYLLSEIKPDGTAVPGVTYDPGQYVVTIKVTQDALTGMSAELANVSKAVKNGTTYAPGEAITGFTADGATNVTFTNVYQAVQGDVVKYQISKNLEGRSVRPGEFEFGLYLNGQLEDVATNDANGIVTFTRTIPATAASHQGMYKMVIKEFAGSIAGVTYSTQEFPIYVKITDNGAGKIEATVHLSETGAALPEDAEGIVDLTQQIVFNNTYEAHDATYTPVAQKELTGRAQLAGEFSFQAQLINNGAPVVGGPVYNGINDANGNILFQTITFTDEGTYIYEITENAGTATGMDYDDTSKYYLKVLVTDEGDGYLKTTATYHSDESCTTAANVVFRNVYTPTTVFVQLQGSKTLTGRALNDKEFSFLVYKDSDLVNPIASGSNDVNGDILFSTFGITAEDMADGQGGYLASKTFTYKIVESDNKLPGIGYAEPVTVTVEVTHSAGVLSAVVNYPDGESAKFVNSYTPAPVEVPLVAYKALTGKNMQTFTFELEAPNGDVVRGYNDASGTVAFRDLVFTAQDMVDGSGNKVMEKTFRYELREKAGQMPGMTYDSTVYEILVTVKDDGNGRLSAAAVYQTGSSKVDVLQFSNTYVVPALELELTATKTIVDTEGNALTGSSYPLDGFQFQVYDANNQFVSDAVSDVNGSITLTGFEFTSAGEYHFTVSEKPTAKPGYTNDPTLWCVHFVIGYNADTGALYKESDYVHVAPQNHSEAAAQASAELEFVNVYDPADVTLTLQALKTLQGRPIREHEFTFYMVDDATGLRAAEARNHENGTISFNLTYSKAGTYTYTVHEQIPATKLGGITYTTQTHKVTVTVTDDGTGALKATVGSVEVTGTGTVDLTGTVVFENTYAPDTPAKVTVRALKNLEGRSLKDNDFSFTLVNKDDPTEIYTASNDKEGDIVFGQITYTAEDMLDANGKRLLEKVFRYTLSEDDTPVPGVTPGGETYTVEVTVTDQGNGALAAEVKYINDATGEEHAPVFHNHYEAKPVTFVPQAKKSFVGGDMLTFNFVLSGEGFASQTKSNNEKGEVTFDALTFQEAGIYTFTITEQADASLKDIKWDTNVYTLVITVTDPGDGQLAIADLSITSDHGKTDLTFRNVHESSITKKDVFVKAAPTVSVDGKSVKTGDVLTYQISYKNYSGLDAEVTITDKIPQHTAYVEGSANNGGTLTDGVLTWKFAKVAPDATVTVTFDVVVTVAGVDIANQATVLEGINTYTTNTAAVTVPVDQVTKDVFLAAEPTVSIDGKAVKEGDVLLYSITYTNSHEAPADVTITDKLSQYIAYVEGSADNGGTFADGVITWKLHLAAGERKTVTFQAKATTAKVSVTNQATALEGQTELLTNVVTTTVQEIPVPSVTPNTGDPTNIPVLAGMMGISLLGIVVTLAVLLFPRKKGKYEV